MDNMSMESLSTALSNVVCYKIDAGI